MVRWFGIGVLAVTLSMAVGSSTARTDSQVESSKAVASDDGKRTVVVDRLTPIVDGEAERFSGRMLIRVSSADGAAPKQRYVEASQVRVIQPPVWIDGSRVCAFVYNVAKNSNGIVYFEPDTNRALQVEFVMPARRMAASGKVEQELTSLEVTEFSPQEQVQPLKVRAVPHNGGSAFPLVLPPLPEFQGRPYDMAFYKQLNASLDAYKAFLQKNSLKNLEPEQASESFNENESWLGLLACGDNASYLLAVPLNKPADKEVLDATKLSRLEGVSLSCSHHAAGDGEDMPMTDTRYLTAWKDARTLQVMQESYDGDADEATLQPVLSLDINTGATEKITTGTTAAP